MIKNVSQDDFLNFESMRFNKFIMNPPFSKSQDVKHILKAYSLLEN
jgi:16S rRNA G1207 methylase RsmC